MNPKHELRDPAAPAYAGHFNEEDPHGAGASQTHHHVVSLTTLRVVLALLLGFTVLTVGAAQFEVWFQGYINYELPRWVNVAIAMTIATVKAAMVLLFFMQLKHDNPINGIIFVLCIVGVGLFLGFTTLDLFTRGRVYDYKGQPVIAGGTGGTTFRRAIGVNEDGTTKYESIDGPIVEYVRKKKINEVGQAEYDRLRAEAHAGHGSHGHHAPHVSTASQSILRAGRTDALESAPAHGDSHGHADSHADSHPDSHTAPAKPGEKPASPPANHAAPGH